MPDDRLQQGLICHQAGDLQTAEALYRLVLRQTPDQALVWHLLGLLQHQLGQRDSALDSIRQATRLEQTQLMVKQPGRTDMLFQLAETWWRLGETELAAQYFEQVIGLEPARAEAHRYLGLVYKRRGQLDTALASFQRAVELEPEYAAAYNNLGSTLGDLGHVAAAADSFRRAIQLEPAMAEAHYNLAVALEMQHDFAGAAASYGRAAELQPDNLGYQLKKAFLMPPLPADRSEIEQWRARFETALSAYQAGTVDLSGDSAPNYANSSLHPPLELAYHGRNDRFLKEKYARLFRTGQADWSPPRLSRGQDERRYRLGFLVTRGHERGFNFFVAGLINHLDQTSFRVTIVCPRVSVERIQPFIKSAHIEFLIIPEHARQAAAQIRQAGLHLLYYWEVGTDPLNYYLPFFRPAPIQCTSWGTPETTGIPAMDYFISSRLFENETGAAHYSETLVPLKTLGMFYRRPQVNGLSQGRAQFGLSATTPLYFCPQNLQKFHPDFDELLAGILRQDTTGQLLLKAHKPPLQRMLLQRWHQHMPDVIERITFVPRQSYDDYLGLLQGIDVLLDTVHYSGGNTSHEAITVGTPIVTWPGEFMRGRMTYGCYQKIGVLDSVVWSAEGYVSKAVQLATDRNCQRQLREKILAANSALYEDIAAVNELEQFFKWAIQRVENDRL